MKNADSRQVAEDALRWVFGVNDKNVKASLKKYANDYGFEPGKIESLWQEIDDLDTYDEVELCVLYSGIVSEYKKRIPSVSELFTDIEISETQRLKLQAKEIKKPDSSITIIKNAFLLIDNQWNVTMSMKDILEIDNSGKIRYNPATQRPMQQSKDDFMARITVNKKQVSEMAEKMSSGKYHPDPITLNVLDDGRSSLEYDEEEKILYIKGIIDIPDGYHRLAAMHKTFKENPHRNMNFPVIVTFLDLAGAQDLLSQRNKGTRIDTRFTKAYEINAANDLVYKIMRHPDASLIYRSNIVKSQEEIDAGGLIRFSELSEAIENEYGIVNSTTPAKTNETVDWLVEFFNEMTNKFASEWESKKRRSKSWKASTYAFPAYVMLSKVLMGKDNWRELLENVLSKIDFSTEGFKGSKPINKAKRRMNDAITAARLEQYEERI